MNPERDRQLKRYEEIALQLNHLEECRMSPVVAQQIHELEQESAELEEMLFSIHKERGE